MGGRRNDENGTYIARGNLSSKLSPDTTLPSVIFQIDTLQINGLVAEVLLHGLLVLRI